ncbi:hypothetical protein CDAR_47651 [Caerostris darwini]|uniref:YCII-related domain-containing protein n=1 Tax=Caerostris darwini TaxID=1538125 RepID=A0AAV4MB61_9ARAC|nr:hypothetical protein CDAR_47651 [Caerostris darwini]
MSREPTLITETSLRNISTSFFAIGSLKLPITGVEKSGPEKRCVGGTLLIAAADDSSEALTSLQKIPNENGAFLMDTKIFES